MATTDLYDVTLPNGDIAVIADSSARSSITDLNNWTSAESKTATGNPITISDAANLNAEELKITVEPIQDLHGYDKPWVGGAGKNKMPLTLADVKSANPFGTWNDNVYTYKGCTFTILLDNGGNVIGIKANNTATSELTFRVPFTGLTAGDYYANGCAGGGSNTTFDIYFYNATTAQGLKQWDGSTNAVNLYDSATNAEIQIPNSTDDLQYRIRIRNGYSANNLMFYPMIRLSTESDTTFAPYSNICPISGLTSGEVKREGKNLLGALLTDVKALNTSGTWTGNTYSRRSVTYECITNADGYITDINVSGTATGGNSNLILWSRSVSNKTLPTGSYTLTGCPSDGSNSSYELQFQGTRNGSLYTYGYDRGSGITGDVLDTDTLQFVVIVYSGYAITGTLQFKPMLRLASVTDATFEPYSHAQATITFGDTVYGGEVDFNSGIVRVDKGYIVFNGSEAWQTTTEIWKLDIVIAYKKGAFINGIANKYPLVTEVSRAAEVPSMSCAFLNSESYNRFMVNDSSYSSMEAFKQSLSDNNLQVVYELATPTTLTLTPAQLELLKGYNTLTTNGATISLTYQPDTLLGEAMEYTDKRLGEKVDKVEGKGLSTNDYTDAEKTKLENIDLADDTLSTQYKLGVSNGLLYIEEV